MRGCSDGRDGSSLSVREDRTNAGCVDLPDRQQFMHNTTHTSTYTDSVCNSIGLQHAEIQYVKSSQNKTPWALPDFTDSYAHDLGL